LEEIPDEECEAANIDCPFSAKIYYDGKGIQVKLSKNQRS